MRRSVSTAVLARGLLFACAALAPLATQAGSVVRFVTPAHLRTALGPTEITLAVTPPEGVEVLRVDVYVDGELLDSLTGPPWTLTWDAGDGSTGHRLLAEAHRSDNTTDRAVIHTSALRINQVVQVDLVNLYAVVRSWNGQYVTDLGREDFVLSEDGRPQEIERFSTEGKPLRIAIVLDTSLSMVLAGGRLDAAKKAALEFLEALEEGDQGMVVLFNDEVRIPATLTDDRTVLAETIRSAKGRGGTALYDAIWRTSRQLRQYDGRRVLVVLSDGRDEAGSGLEPGSLHTLDEALEAAKRSDVMIFAIGIGKQLKDLDFLAGRTLESILREMAEETGGQAIFLTRSGQLKRAFKEVALDLRHQYSIAYDSDNAKRDGSWRTIRLTVPGRDLEVITRRGYYAPSDDDEDSPQATR